MQRQEQVAIAGFPAAQFHESCSQSAAVRVGRQPTQKSHSLNQLLCSGAEIGARQDAGWRQAGGNG